MKTIQERLRDGADICYARNIQLDYARVVTEAADRIDTLEAEVTTMQDHITEITSEEHSIPELRQELFDQLEEKRKCYFAVSQYQKANQNLLEQVAALAADKDVLLGHMATIRNCTNDPAISMLTNLVLERMAQEGGK